MRVDAGGDVGLGHFYRSLNLADSLSLRGHKVIFISEKSSFWECKRDRIPFKHYFRSKSIHELILVKIESIDVFYCDGIIKYNVDYLQNLRTQCLCISYQNYAANVEYFDVLIFPTPIFEHYNIPKETNLRIYEGFKYFLCKKSIKNLPSADIKKEIKNIGIISGGSDCSNTAGEIALKIKNLIGSEMNMTVFIGNDNVHEDFFTTNKIQSDKYNELSILQMDLVVSAFGVSTYEMLLLGIPVIAYAHKPSNLLALTAVKKFFQFESVGLIDKVSEESLQISLEKMMSQEAREKASRQAMKMLDVFGIDRIMEIIENNE